MRKSWLQLAPDGPPGRLSPDMLRRMDLRGCGTLVLGACESGMAEIRRRDERVGFVRAGIQAGAASVVAARWRGQDPMASYVLDRFERYVRYLPRDEALRLAQLDACRQAPELDHPAYWGCWTLYGDSGYQVGLIRRLVRRIRERGRQWREVHR